HVVALPRPVHAQAHQVVHQVVVACDRSEYLADQLLLVLGIDIAEAEMGGSRLVGGFAHASIIALPAAAGTPGRIMASQMSKEPCMIATPDYHALLQTAIAEARQGLAEGGVPIGAALYHDDGRLLGCGHNRRVQEGDP